MKQKRQNTILWAAFGPIFQDLPMFESIHRLLRHPKEPIQLGPTGNKAFSLIENHQTIA